MKIYEWVVFYDKLANYANISYLTISHIGDNLA